MLEPTGENSRLHVGSGTGDFIDQAVAPGLTTVNGVPAAGSCGGQGTFSGISGDLPVAMQRNTFAHLTEGPSALERSRSLLRHRSDGDEGDSRQSQTSLSSAPSRLPPSQLRRINGDGDAVPGSQDNELATRAQQQLSMATDAPAESVDVPHSSVNGRDVLDSQ